MRIALFVAKKHQFCLMDNVLEICFCTPKTYQTTTTMVCIRNLNHRKLSTMVRIYNLKHASNYHNVGEGCPSQNVFNIVIFLILSMAPLCKGRDALNKQLCELFVAKAGSNAMIATGVEDWCVSS